MNKLTAKYVIFQIKSVPWFYIKDVFFGTWHNCKTKYFGTLSSFVEKGFCKRQKKWDVNDDDNNADNDRQTIDCDQKSSPETSAQVS